MPIRLDHVCFNYGQGPILTQISLTINRGDFFGITGINGSGKSTLLYLLNGIIPNQIKGKLSGKITVDNQVPNPQTVGLIFQNPDFSLFNLTVRDEVGFNNPPEKIIPALKAVNLLPFIDRDPQTLSFGQKQKVCLASLLARNLDYLVLDEPTAMLDYKSSLELYVLLHRLNQQGKTIIVVEHDTDFLRQYANRLAILHQGKILKLGNPKTILQQKSLLKKIGIKC